MKQSNDIFKQNGMHLSCVCAGNNEFKSSRFVREEAADNFNLRHEVEEQKAVILRLEDGQENAQGRVQVKG
jgi:hypothetical protein